MRRLLLVLLFFLIAVNNGCSSLGDAVSVTTFTFLEEGEDVIASPRPVPINLGQYPFDCLGNLHHCPDGFTLRFWLLVTPGNPEVPHHYLVSSGGQTHRSEGWYFRQNYGKEYEAGVAYGDRVLTASFDMESDKSVWLAMVWDPRALKVYVDGLLAATDTEATSRVYSPSVIDLFPNIVVGRANHELWLDPPGVDIPDVRMGFIKHWALALTADDAFEGTAAVESRQIEYPDQVTASAKVPSHQQVDPPIVYMLTPTYRRLSQRPDMVRLSQTLRLVKDLHWVVVEDAAQPTDWVAELLVRDGHSHTYLACTSDVKLKRTSVRGLSQRNCALNWLLSQNITTGVFYFGDDDNTYDTRLFDEIRTTKQVSILPTGMMGEYGVSSPVIQDGNLVSFLDLFDVRKFNVDMASVAYSVRFWLEKGAPLMKYVGGGMLETSFLESLGISIQDLEPKADNCTKILVWHTRTANVERLPKVDNIKKKIANYNETNVAALITEIDFP